MKNNSISVAELCSSFVRIRSYPGEEEAIVNELKGTMGEVFDTVTVDRYGSIVGCLTGNHDGPVVLFDTHVDTVPADPADGWTRDPWSGEIADGRVHGRGSSDMKGALSAMIVAAGRFGAAHASGFAGSIAVAGGVYEEGLESIAARAVSAALDPDVVIIGESSDLDLAIGQRGRAEIVLETFGVASHSARPEAGINAVYHMTELVNRIRGLEPTHHPVLGDGILVVTDVRSQPYPANSVVPHYCRATLDRRLLVGETPETVLAPIQNVISELAEHIEGFRASVSIASDTQRCYTGEEIGGERFFPAWLFEESRPEIQSVQAALKRAGIDAELSHYTFCTNGSHYAGEKGILTLGFGPSREDLAHTVDEYVEIEQLEHAADGYLAIMEELTRV